MNRITLLYQLEEYKNNSPHDQYNWSKLYGDNYQLEELSDIELLELYEDYTRHIREMCWD